MSESRMVDARTGRATTLCSMSRKSVGSRVSMSSKTRSSVGSRNSTGRRRVAWDRSALARAQPRPRVESHRDRSLARAEVDLAPSPRTRYDGSMKSRFDFLTALLLLPLAACPGDDGTANDETSTSTPVTGTATDTTTDTPPTDTTTDTPATDTADTMADSTGTPGDGGFCIHQCRGDADCMVGGMDAGLTCQDSVCTGDVPAGCTDDAECVALLSGWTGSPCTAGGGECEPLGQLCVPVGDGGGCATPPGEFFPCNTVPGWSELEVLDIDGNTVTVCGNGNAECNDDGFCFSPCQADADCASKAYPVCDTATGLCGCGSDDDCAALGEPHLAVCNAGVCGCNSDQQCVDGEAGDACTADGFCGCTADAACSNVENFFDGGTIGCVML